MYLDEPKSAQVERKPDMLVLKEDLSREISRYDELLDQLDRICNAINPIDQSKSNPTIAPISREPIGALEIFQKEKDRLQVKNEKLALYVSHLCRLFG